MLKTFLHFFKRLLGKRKCFNVVGRYQKVVNGFIY